jgi:hypothetical protein
VPPELFTEKRWADLLGRIWEILGFLKKLSNHYNGLQERSAKLLSKKSLTFCDVAGLIIKNYPKCRTGHEESHLSLKDSQEYRDEDEL